MFDQSQELHSHARVARFVDDDSLARLINVMVHAKVGSHAVQQHAMIRSHLRKLLVLVTVRDIKQKAVRIFSFNTVFQ